ncbi:MAG: DUF5119 domain-containing protein [Rikenellaceae bacterium]
MKRIFTFLICLTLISSCKQELCKWSSQSDTSAIQLFVDWSESNIDQADINNLSIYSYPEGGGSPYLKVSGNIDTAYINLPAAEYSLLIFNDIAGDIAGLNFRDDSSYNEFYAEIIEESDSSGIYYDILDGEILATDHGQLAVWRVTEFEVTSNMVSCIYCGETHSEEVEIDVAPTPITTQCIFTVRVKNLNNAQIIQGVVKGFAAGAYLASEERLSTPNNTIIYSFNFTSATYDDEDFIDGVIESEITTFGKEPDENQTYELELDVILNSGELVTFTRDITEQVKEQSNLKILISLESDENMIVLPEGNGTGFGVEAWGDREVITLR